MSALLDARGVSKAFAGVHAVVDASLIVEPASITALIGPNGAGKSTLFNCISGFLRPDEGRIELAGQRIDRRPPHVIVRAGLGRTFQTARALTRMSVLDNVRLAAPAHPGESRVGLVGRRRAVRRREREVTAQAHDLLRLVRLDGHADALSGTLSGGQRKLLDLARILMASPRLILLDEPMAGVNPAVREELLDHVLELRASRKIAFLIVEHDLGFVMQASDRVVVMNDGAILMEGTPDEVRGDARVIDAYLGVHA
jgi:ABC-type branched-subunit amino acid transport system ATPase component